MLPCADIRQQRGLSIAAAAARLKVSPRYLSAIERGRQPLTWGLAERMAKLYRVGELGLIIRRKEGEAASTPR